MKRRYNDRGRKLRKDEKLVPRDDPRLVRDYPDIVAVFPHAEFVSTREEGIDNPVLRFRENKLTRWLVDSGQVDLTNLSIEYERGLFSIDEAMEFWQGLGYSLSGFLEIFGDEVARRYKRQKKGS